MKRLKARITLNKGNSKFWSDESKILKFGEIGYNYDTNVFKIGDGTNPWSSLPVSFIGFIENSGTLIDAGGSDEDTSSCIGATLVILNETSKNFSDSYIMRKGEVVSIVEGANQYLKVGDGVRSIKDLPCVVPLDDVVISSVYGECQDFEVEVMP